MRSLSHNMSERPMAFLSGAYEQAVPQHDRKIRRDHFSFAFFADPPLF